MLGVWGKHSIGESCCTARIAFALRGVLEQRERNSLKPHELLDINEIMLQRCCVHLHMHASRIFHQTNKGARLIMLDYRDTANL